MKKPEATSIRCYAVPATRLGDALAGRLLADTGAAKPDQDAERWRYRDGLAAGERWACELATFADLEQLPADAGAACPVASPWLRGFVEGALRGCQDVYRTA